MELDDKPTIIFRSEQKRTQAGQPYRVMQNGDVLIGEPPGVMVVCSHEELCEIFGESCGQRLQSRLDMYVLRYNGPRDGGGKGA